MSKETVNHPAHYGGDTPYEAIKIIEDWGLGFSLGNALKYLLRAPHKGSELEDLQKCLWYLRRAYTYGVIVSPAAPCTLEVKDVAEHWGLLHVPRFVVLTSIYFRDLEAGTFALEFEIRRLERATGPVP